MKTILIALSALVLCSCVDETIVKDTRDTKSLVFGRVYHFSYKSHDYIMFRDGYGKVSVAGVVHDPDCKCKEETK